MGKAVFHAMLPSRRKVLENIFYVAVIQHQEAVEEVRIQEASAS
jgi:hypothetical protein